MASTYVPAIKKERHNILYHALLSISFSTPIILSSAVDRVFFEKNKLPSLSRRDIVSLFLFTMTLTYSIDYLQSYNYIPQIIKFEDKS